MASRRSPGAVDLVIAGSYRLPSGVFPLPAVSGCIIGTIRRHVVLELSEDGFRDGLLGAVG